jgi:hypothetical protein
LSDGWFLDPFRRHHDRYFANGSPTDLVRDGLHESFDPPPELLLSAPLVPVPLAGPSGGPRDLRRADASEAVAAFDPRTAADRATSAMVRFGAAR